MGMSKKPRKNCQNCKALSDVGNKFCLLRYSTKNKPHRAEIQRLMMGIPNPCPNEPCPKPLTNKDFIRAKESRVWNSAMKNANSKP